MSYDSTITEAQRAARRRNMAVVNGAKWNGLPKVDVEAAWERYRASDKPLAAIARELGVSGYRLDRSLREAGHVWRRPRSRVAKGGELAEDAWLAGFTDGEGSFGVYPDNGKGDGFVPRFVINLRADDAAILDALADTFGGTLRMKKSDHYPQAQWRVLDKAGLRALVRYFDRFPLRAKKAHDYAIWRLAVEAYCRVGRSAEELPALADALRDGREFERQGRATA